MKKIIILVLLLTALFVSASAQEQLTVAEVAESASESWTATYKTPWRTVEIHVKPTVPAVDRMQVFKVRPAFWLPEPISDTLWTAFIPHAEDGGDYFHLSRGDDSDKNHQATNGVANVVSESYYVYAPLQRDATYAPGNELTLEDMIAQLEEILAEIKPWKPAFDTQHILSIRVGVSRNGKTGELLLPSYMEITLPQLLEGAPLWGHVIDSVETHGDHELFYKPCVSFSMRNKADFSLSGRVLRVEQVLAEDVPLCSFSKVQNALETEIHAGHIRAIYSVDLGYALYNEPGAVRLPGEKRAWMKRAAFYAKPAWRCVCLYTKTAEKDLSESVYTDPAVSLYYKTLYVDAQTGELIDPTDGRPGCGDYAGNVVWEIIQ